VVEYLLSKSETLSSNFSTITTKKKKKKKKRAQGQNGPDEQSFPG
jgi:hypothetical protein